MRHKTVTILTIRVRGQFVKSVTENHYILYVNILSQYWTTVWKSWLGDLSGEFDFSIKVTYLPKAPAPAPTATARNTFHPLTPCSLR